MEVMDIRKEGAWQGLVRPITRMLVIATLALFGTGFFTEAIAQGSGSTIVVRARGTAGGESISLRVGSSNVATWSLTTSYQNFTATTSLSGAVSVAFTNDGGNRDVQVDYIIVNGETRQSENQSSNTGLYANGRCGGGSNSEWMHCNGAITYGQVSSSSGNSIVVRARGTSGSESVSLRIDNTNVATWTLTTSMQDYSASTSLEGGITVAFTNDASGRDVQVDYIVVNGSTRQAEAQSYNTALYANGSCGGGGNSEWMHCNGVIGFGDVSGGDDNPPPLGKFVGNITTNGAVRSDFLQYWDQITPENEGKWASVEATRDVYNWSGVDRVYNFAMQNHIPFKQHTFVWGNQSPSWINSLSPSEQAAEIEEWIRDFCARYPETAMIDVVNEATPGHAPAGYAQSAFGSNWIVRSFQLARQYCPKAILVLNDYNVLSWDTNAFIQMATPAVNAGVVDAIGAQAHGLEGQSLSSIQGKLNQVAALGLPIYITEYDVARTNDQEQLQIMQTQFPAFYNSPSVAGITLWGYVVGSTWVNGSGLIQSNGTPRPAMTWLMNYLGR